MKKKHCTAQRSAAQRAYTQNELEMSWTQGEHDRQAAQKEVGQREREGEAKAISEERDKTATNSSNIGGGIAQNLNDKQTERQRDKQTDRDRHTNEWTAGQTDKHRRQLFTYKHSVTDKRVSEQEREREAEQQQIQLNIEITNPQLSCAL